ncbi:MAG: hypothetical protein QME90_02720 [Thermodesulfobacteriota bacterium]|nr:hypothetical protein [Thermodesulfobacteriota bacterium]
MAKKKMKINVDGPKPITGSKYLKPTKDNNPKKILLGASFAGKNFPFSPFPPEKVCIMITAVSPMRVIEPNKGKSPPPGDLKDPMG